MKISIKIDQNTFEAEGEPENIQESAIRFIQSCAAPLSKKLEMIVSDIKAHAITLTKEAHEIRHKAKSATDAAESHG